MKYPKQKFILKKVNYVILKNPRKRLSLGLKKISIIYTKVWYQYLHVKRNVSKWCWTYVKSVKQLFLRWNKQYPVLYLKIWITDTNGGKCCKKDPIKECLICEFMSYLYWTCVCWWFDNKFNFKFKSPSPFGVQLVSDSW